MFFAFNFSCDGFYVSPRYTFFLSSSRFLDFESFSYGTNFFIIIHLRLFGTEVYHIIKSFSIDFYGNTGGIYQNLLLRNNSKEYKVALAVIDKAV